MVRALGRNVRALVVSSCAEKPDQQDASSADLAGTLLNLLAGPV
ncbi:hypothetical protein [Mycobacterium lepromatosis]|nr:hypothetical protein [Mycobacterium lepromatosis]